MKAYGGVDFLDLGTSWRWVVSFTPRPFYPREKSPWYPLDRRLCGPRSRSGRRGEEKVLDPTGTRTPTPRTCNPYRLRYPGSPSSYVPIKNNTSRHCCSSLLRYPLLHVCSTLLQFLACMGVWGNPRSANFVWRLLLELTMYLSIYGSTILLDLGRFFQFLTLYTVGRTPWMGDQPVARPLPTNRTT
jgi:hypothetical protein